MTEVTPTHYIVSAHWQSYSCLTGLKSSIKHFYKKNVDFEILGKFGKLPIGQILSDLDKFCFAELSQGRSS